MNASFFDEKQLTRYWFFKSHLLMMTMSRNNPAKYPKDHTFATIEDGTCGKGKERKRE